MIKSIKVEQIYMYVLALTSTASFIKMMRYFHREQHINTFLKDFFQGL